MTHTAELSPQPAAAVLSGRWSNQLGSQLSLRADDQGRLEGEFWTVSGALAGRPHPVIGVYDAPPAGPVILLSLVVDWVEAHCITAWSGHFVKADGSIRASWLMTTETAPGDEWKATTTGQDVFHRLPG